MDLTQLANLGEFIGGVAVLVTLIYLAVQVRQTNQLNRAQVRQETSRMSTEILLSMGQQDLDLLAAAYQDLNAISDSQRRYIGAKFLGTANYYETLFYARERGTVDEDLWKSQQRRMANFFGPAKDSLWPVWKHLLGERFQGFVENEVLPDEPISQSTWAGS